jgi:uncharacterized protein with LGFP repeats
VPQGAFLAIWQSDPARQSVLGCPTSNHPRITPEAWEVLTAYQPFEHGAMIWSDHIGWYEQPVIYVLYDDGSYFRYDDTYTLGDPVSGGEIPPLGLYEPTLGFGKVWRDNPGVRAALGWATAVEAPGAGRFQLFMGGSMIWLSQRGESFIFISDPPTYAVETTPSF